MIRFLLVCFLIVGAVPWVLAAALPPELAARAWKPVTFDGKRPNMFRACGEDCIAVSTDQSVSLIGRPVAPELSGLPRLAWEWKLDAPPVETELSVKGRDDRALALYVTFSYDPDTATFGEKMLRPFVEMSQGADTPGRTIMYVWAGDGTPGQIVESPYFGSVVKMIVARNGTAPTGRWLSEQVDLVADHERLFESKPTRVAHILIGADSDDTKSRNRGFVRNISFRAP